MRPGQSANKTQLLLDAASKRFKACFAAGRFADALAQCLQAARLAPGLATPWSDAAVCCIKLERWDDAIAHARRALRLPAPNLATYDALAHAYGAKNDREETARWGRAALELRLRSFGGPPPIPHQAAPLPPPPGPATRQHNIIAFSLFGASPKYCECAVLNARERERLYPDWTCHFYIDDSVPQAVAARLQMPGSEVIRIAPEIKTRWPGPMWRFLAYDTPGVHRVIFRDADSVISAREARTVHAWIESNRHFHVIRDAATHTELMLAGLWGVTGGAMPAMATLADRFLATPVDNRHFADQYFLRQWVWPYARQSLLQHDSFFGFLGPQPFPDGPTGVDQHVGFSEGAASFSISTTLPEHSPARWTLYRVDASRSPPGEEAICSYPGTVENGSIRDHLPKRYGEALRAGTMTVRVSPV